MNETAHVQDKTDKIQQLHKNLDNSVSMGNRMLSPFTWSNLNIKLPIIKKKTSNTVTIQEEKTIIIEKRAKGKSNYNGKMKLESISKTIDAGRSLKKETRSEQMYISVSRQNKQSADGVSRSINLQRIQGNQIQNPERLKLYKRDLITRHLQKSTTRQQSPKQLMQQTTKNISRLRSPLSSAISKPPVSCIPQTFSYNKIQTYLFKGLTKSDWNQVSPRETDCVPELVWCDHYAENTKFNNSQLHNHMKNAHLLTTKGSLHQVQAVCGSAYYPQSYLMPFEYESFCQDYEQQIVKICLRQIIKSAADRVNYENKPAKNLGEVLSELAGKGTTNDDTLMGLKLCLYLQRYRKCKNYRYFEQWQTYVPIETRLQPSVLSSLLKACYQYWQNIVKNQKSMHNHTQSYLFRVSNINQEVIDILFSYHCMLLKYERDYKNMPSRNAWIVKPIASSRGAGISLLRNSAQYLSINHERFEHGNRAKYANKIIQKYIEQPLLLKQLQFYSNRKFDIRQWVLLACDKESKHPLVYVYNDAYCRFSDMKFTYNYYRSDQSKIHLTNYSVSDKLKNPQHSLLLLTELFQVMPELKSDYEQQINKIVVETVMNTKDVRFQENKFELLGYDVIFDVHKKLWLLEINMNPACQASRAPKLQKMADRMIAGMMKIVKAASGKIIIEKTQREQIGWKIIYGEQKFKQIDLENMEFEPSIKPFYDVSLGKDSFVEQVRRRSIMTSTIQKIVTIRHLRQIWSRLFNYDQRIAQNANETSQSNQQNQQKNENLGDGQFKLSNQQGGEVNEQLK